jgi:hypothetical protein
MSDTELLAKPEPVRRLEVFPGAGRRRVTLSMPIDGPSWGQPGLLITERERRPHVS